MISITDIVEILNKNPNALKAKEIASYFPGSDRKSINQILYANPDVFVINKDYEWTIKNDNLSALYNSSPLSIKDIKTFFPKEFIDNDLYDILKNKSRS